MKQKTENNAIGGTEKISSNENSPEGGTISKAYNGICVKVYLSHEKFAEIAALAEKAGKRRVGLVLYTQKKHGFADEKLANTDGLARFLKMAGEFWGEQRTEMEEKAKHLRLERDKLAKYGIKL